MGSFPPRQKAVTAQNSPSIQTRHRSVGGCRSPLRRSAPPPTRGQPRRHHGRHQWRRKSAQTLLPPWMQQVGHLTGIPHLPGALRTAAVQGEPPEARRFRGLQATASGPWKSRRRNRQTLRHKPVVQNSARSREPGYSGKWLLRPHNRMRCSPICRGSPKPGTGQFCTGPFAIARHGRILPLCRPWFRRQRHPGMVRPTPWPQ